MTIDPETEQLIKQALRDFIHGCEPGGVLDLGLFKMTVLSCDGPQVTIELQRIGREPETWQLTRPQE
jgi:hypothetical protein